MTVINIKRIYEPPAKPDGFRVLVDRLWPRGLKKQDAAIDQWSKQVAPSADLRKWFNHEPEKFHVFTNKYLHELKNNEAVNELLHQLEEHKVITLLYGAHDQEHNHAIVLRNFIKENLRKP